MRRSSFLGQVLTATARSAPATSPVCEHVTASGVARPAAQLLTAIARNTPAFASGSVQTIETRPRASPQSSPAETITANGAADQESVQDLIDFSNPIPSALQRVAYRRALTVAFAAFAVTAIIASVVIAAAVLHPKARLQILGGQPSPITTPTTPQPGQVISHGVTVEIGSVSNDPDATSVAETLAAYFGGINSRNYRDAWDTYTAAEQANVPYDAFASNESTTQDKQITVQSIQHDSGGNLEADVSFQTRQAGQFGPNPGETCTNWTLDYHLVPATGVTSGAVPYLIDKATPLGVGHTAC
jgi:hypothetical protein